MNEQHASRSATQEPAEQWWAKLADDGAGNLNDPRFRVFTSAEQNADDAAREQGFAPFSVQWYEAWASSYNFLREQKGSE
ncbi:hypothetical protein EV193_104355 [Herbihabitans rhizosphaerae]|uniref:Uncharacterized protein n=1 Tax=Herbihabitans rhizosphaerae TaxID=1872711 RepID=A0A4Q7KQN7_9PSEU|nr:hypothetical protein [Herbihabitans rhizosphaerae]RZS39139.1 hypothetical protein EV193_104355 [Herbihabitans rhizosphaerae]